ncbi:MAG: amidohydrolase family protein [Gemmatimonadota bacterium]|nr:amidohydrolase family protein [Gemmatimonadota bacterium]
MGILAGLMVAASCGPGDSNEIVESDSAVAGVSRPAADAHLHLRTAATAELIERIEPGSGTEPTLAADAIAALDAAGVQHGLVLSLAYLFGAPGVDLPDEAALVRAENDYVAAQVGAYPNRLTAACSVNPLASYALSEIRRCLVDLELRVLKLHFTNSGVDLRSEADRNRLRQVFSLLDRHDAGAFVHMRGTAEDYGSEDARYFIDDVLARVPGVPVHIAHMAGWGGYDAATDSALSEFVKAIEEGRLDPARIWFGLGAVVFLPEAAGADTTLARTVREANGQLALRIRALGLDRVTYGTDWPGWPPVPEMEGRIAANIELVRAALGLDAAELAVVFSNLGLLEATGR